MAKLRRETILERWKAPKNKQAIDRAASDNERQLFHARMSMDENDSNPYLQTFLSKVKAILNNTQKYNKFVSLLDFPLASNNLISKASDEWNKIFSAKDRLDEYRFDEEELEDDFDAFREKINFTSIIEQSLFTKIKQSVNTIAVVDVPEVEDDGDSFVNPYIYFVETGACKDIEVNHVGQIQFVMFETGSVEKKNKRLIVIDTEYYRSFDITDKQELANPKESAHGLGYCPATFIWRDVVDPDLPIRRFNAVTEKLAVLDKYVMADVFKDHADLYASFPIMWKYNDACDDYVNDRGEILDDEGRVIGKKETPYMGPGWQVDMEVPVGESARMGVPVGFVNAERTLLDYNVEKVRLLGVELLSHMTGVDKEVQDEKAFNESQIRSQYETRQAVLKYWAENIQFVHQFLAGTLAKLRYGDRFISVNIDYGEDYFLYDALTATKNYQEAKEAGLPSFIVASHRKIVQQIITRTSPNMKARYDIMERLEPYLDRPLSEIDPLTPEYELKANFQGYIDRFELENGSIITWGKDIEFGKKISLIRLTLYDYVREQRKFSEKNSIKPKETGNDVRKSGQGQAA